MNQQINKTPIRLIIRAGISRCLPFAELSIQLSLRCNENCNVSAKTRCDVTANTAVGV